MVAKPYALVACDELGGSSRFASQGIRARGGDGPPTVDAPVVGSTPGFFADLAMMWK